MGSFAATLCHCPVRCLLCTKNCNNITPVTSAEAPPGRCPSLNCTMFSSLMYPCCALNHLAIRIRITFFSLSSVGKASPVYPGLRVIAEETTACDVSSLARFQYQILGQLKQQIRFYIWELKFADAFRTLCGIGLRWWVAALHFLNRVDNASCTCPPSVLLVETPQQASRGPGCRHRSISISDTVDVHLLCLWPSQYNFHLQS